MTNDIHDPLAEYVNVFRDRFYEVAEDTFSGIAEEANVDIELNKQTCRKIYAKEKELSSVKNRADLWKFWRAMLWACVFGGIIAAYVKENELTSEQLLLIFSAIAIIIAYLFLRVHRRIDSLNGISNNLESTIHNLRDEAWKQMSPLNRLFDWDILTRMMSKTVPRLEFDPYFTTQRLADLTNVYAWDGSFNDNRSVIYSLSGLINGNPFVICRTRKMEMGTKTYYGSKTITWTTRERDSDGKYHTVYHTEVLTASVTAPYPEYYEKTRVIYGNTAAPDLIFYRRQNGLANKEGSLSFKWKKYLLRRKARNLSNADFAMMTNEEFEVAFNTSNRNNNQQFALLFTPLAQESIMALLKDKTVGYGDDFDFQKQKMINFIIPNHLQNLNLDMNPSQYQHFDYEKAKAYFRDVNAQYFRAIYFSLAPLLCVPMYQQIRPPHDIYGRNMKCHSAFWEHEALANFWGQKHFMHPSCVTDCILKTKQSNDEGDKSTITVYAHGYRAVQHLSYIDRWGGDGRMHKVPVYWHEYLPVTGTGKIRISEDNNFHDDVTISNHQRIEHICSVIKDTKLNIYRRHIASSV